MTRASEQGLTPFDIECEDCGAQPKRPCARVPAKVGPYHQGRKVACHARRTAAGESSPVVDVTALRRERDMLRDQLAAVERGARSLAIRYSALVEAASKSVDPSMRSAADAARRAFQPLPAMPRAPLEMDDDLRRALERDSAALHDGTH